MPPHAATADPLKGFASGSAKISARRFNQVRQERHSGVASFDKWTIADCDLREFNLSSARFFGCIFENVSFSSMTASEFAGCEFINCSIVSGVDGRGNLSQITFFECEMKGQAFEEIEFDSVRFVNSIFVSPLQFRDCVAISQMTFDGCGDVKSLNQIGQLNFVRGAGFIHKRANIGRNLVNWERIRFLSKIPVLQISLLGLTMLTATSFIFDGLGAVDAAFEASCKEILLKVGREDLTTHCSASLLQRATSVAFVSYSKALIIFLLLGLASVLQILCCPEEVHNFSRSEWIRSLNMPSGQYAIIARQAPISAWTSALLYTIATILVLQSIGEKLWKFAGHGVIF